MLQSSVVVDLPSAEIRRAPRPSEWVRSLFATEATPGTGREELTISVVALITSLHHAFRVVGVADAVSLTVDGKVVWTDPHDRPDDLERMWAHVREQGVLDKPFDAISLVLTRRWQGLFLLFDLRLARTVVIGQAEMVVEVYARPDLSPRLGDGPRAAWDRAYAWFADPHALDRARIVVAAQVRALQDALAAAIPDSVVQTHPTQVVLVRPTAEEVQGLVARRWPYDGGPRWRIGFPEAPKAPDPLAALWEDPGFAIVRTAAYAATIREADAGTRRAGVIVVDASGHALFDGGDAEAHADAPWAGRWLRVGDDALTIGAPFDDDDFDALPDDALTPFDVPAPEDAPTAAPAGRRGATRAPAEPTWVPPDVAAVDIAEDTSDPVTSESVVDDATLDTNLDDDPFDDWADLVEIRNEARRSLEAPKSDVEEE